MDSNPVVVTAGSTMEIPPKWSAADCHARADELEQWARKATAASAREQCLFSAGLWRSLAKEAEARETAAHNLAGGLVLIQRLANLPPPLVRQTNSYAFSVNFQPPAPYRVRPGTVHLVTPDNVSPFVRMTVCKLVNLPAQTPSQLFDRFTLLHYTTPQYRPPRREAYCGRLGPNVGEPKWWRAALA